MPYIHCVNTGEMSPDAKQQLVDAIVRAVMNRTGKPENFIMTRLEDNADLRLGDSKSAAYVEVRLVGGLGGTTKRDLTEDICEAYGEILNIPPDKVYVVFDEVAGGNWGWNNQTFG